MFGSIVRSSDDDILPPSRDTEDSHISVDTNTVPLPPSSFAIERDCTRYFFKEQFVSNSASPVEPSFSFPISFVSTYRQRDLAKDPVPTFEFLQNTRSSNYFSVSVAGLNGILSEMSSLQVSTLSDDQLIHLATFLETFTDVSSSVLREQPFELPCSESEAETFKDKIQCPQVFRSEEGEAKSRALVVFSVAHVEVNRFSFGRRSFGFDSGEPKKSVETRKVGIYDGTRRRGGVRLHMFPATVLWQGVSEKFPGAGSWEGVSKKNEVVEESD